MIKILASSDFHGNLPYIKDSFDLFLIAGDVCPAHDQYYAFQMEWLMNEFAEWVNDLPFTTAWSKVILVPGNHDFALERISHTQILELEAKCGGRLKFLRHDIYQFEFPVSDGLDSLTIFGTPYCSIFGHWAFMINDEALEKKFSQIPEGVDILVSHDSPNIGKIGAILTGPWANDTTGNAILAKHIERIHPKLFVSGHFHSGNHDMQYINGTYMTNVSYVGEDYSPMYPIREIPYDEERRIFYP
jgi:Icc-related predicted phosphoesterase